MPAGNPMGYNAYAAGQQQAQATLGLTPAPRPQMPNTAGQPASAPPQRPPAMPRPQPAPAMPTPPSAMVAQNAFATATQQGANKNAAFSMSPNPDTRALEAKRDTVRQPETNERRNIATGVDPAFNYLANPSESDPYTIPRMF